MLMAWGLNAQLVNNNGAMVYTNAGCEVYVLGDGLANNSGTMENAGYWYIDGDMENGGLLTGFGQSTGVYEVKQNWLNNGAFQADQSEVVLSGGDQNIGGASVSSFYNLSLLGTGIKNQSVNAEVQNRLDLSSIELNTDEYEMYLSSTDPLAIARSTGFVSSQGNGRLSWNLSIGGIYFYPAGFHQSNSDLRPVAMRANNAGVYKVRLAEGEATDEGYDLLNVNAPGICEVNKSFFHYVDAEGAGNADISIYSLPSVDGEWDRLIQWNGFEWNDTEVPTVQQSSGYDVLSISDWTDFDEPVFDLASSETPEVNFANDAYEIHYGQQIALDAFYDGDENTIADIEWFALDELDDTDALYNELTPESTGVYGIEITNELGCKTSDEAFVRVKEGQLMLPTAFSPNNDGYNDELQPTNPNITELEYAVYNRWGQQIFTGNLDNPAWDGTFNGEPQDIGVYPFIAKFRLGDGKRELTEKGNITLLR